MSEQDEELISVRPDTDQPRPWQELGRRFIAGTSPTAPASDHRGLVESVRAGHYQAQTVTVRGGDGTEWTNTRCAGCAQPWPCDAARLAEALEQAERRQGITQHWLDEFQSSAATFHLRAVRAERREQDLLKLAEEKGWGYFYDQRYDNAMVEVVRLRDENATRARELAAARGAFAKYGGHLVTCRYKTWLHAHPVDLEPDEPACSCGFAALARGGGDR